MDCLYIYLIFANVKLITPLLIMQYMLYTQKKSRGYGPIVIEILARRGVKVKNDENSMVAKAGKRFNARFLYKSHYYFLNRHWINKDYFLNLNHKVKQEMCRRWANSTTFTAPPIDNFERRWDSNTRSYSTYEAIGNHVAWNAMKRKGKKRRVHEARGGGSYKARMLASLRTARGRSTSRQHQGQEAQPTLVNVMTQFQIMN